MDLQNILAYKRNTQVSVNGVIYDIDGCGVIRNVAQAHADKLLQNRNWRIWTERKVVEPQTVVSDLKLERQPFSSEISAPTQAFDMSMSKGRLQALARKQGIEFDEQTTKRQLIKLIGKGS